MTRILGVFVLVVMCAQYAWAAEVEASDGCSASGGLAFVCGPVNAEDLVSVPGTHWILSSGMVAGGGIYLVDSVGKTWAQKYDSSAATVRHDTATYNACPGPPVLESFETHGMHLRPGADKIEGAIKFSKALTPTGKSPAILAN